MSSVSGRNFVVSRPGWVSSRSSANEKNRDNETEKKTKFSLSRYISSFNNDPFTAAIYSLLIERKTLNLLYFYFVSLRYLCVAIN